MNHDVEDDLVEQARELEAQERHDEAAACAQQAIARDPSNAAAHALRGRALTNLGRYNAAVSSLQRAVELGSDTRDVHNALGAALLWLGDITPGIEHLRRAVELAPDDARQHSHLGIVLSEAGRFDESRAEHDLACAIEPDNILFRIYRSLGALARGDLESGWDEHELRLDPSVRGDARHLDLPRWDGSSLAGRTVLAHLEQGLGDELIFGTCYPDLAAEAEHLVVECSPRLHPLFARSFPDATVRADGDPAPLPPIDVVVPAGSIPRWRRRTHADFPTGTGYLRADPAAVRRFAEWLASLPAPRIGISWRSGLMTPKRRRWYPPLEEWAPVFAGTDATFVCLQYDDASADRAAISRRFGVDVLMPPDLDLHDDLDGVAALCSALDLVVTVNNAVAALAGAVGARTLVVTTAYDGMTALGTNRWPWFPSVRTFEREPHESWSAPLQRLGAALAAAAAHTSSS